MVKKVIRTLVLAGLLVAAMSTYSLADTVVKVDRVQGNNRYTTATAVATEYLGDRVADNIVLASGVDYPDAISGGLFAKQKSAPILLISGDPITDSITLTYAYSHIKKGGTFYILGGVGAVNSNVETKLKGDGYNVIRFGGKDRYETCALINKEIVIPTGMHSSIELVNGYDIDYLMACNSSVNLEMPSINKDISMFFLVDSNCNISQSTADIIKSTNPTDITLLINGVANAPSQESQIRLVNSLGRKDIKMMAITQGKSSLDILNSAILRMYLSQNITTKPKYDAIFATSNNFADSLTCSSLVGKYNIPMVLTDNANSLKVALHGSRFVEAKGSVTNSLIIGGTGAVNKDTEDFITNNINSYLTEYEAPPTTSNTTN